MFNAHDLMVEAAKAYAKRWCAQRAYEYVGFYTLPNRLWEFEFIDEQQRKCRAALCQHPVGEAVNRVRVLV